MTEGRRNSGDTFDRVLSSTPINASVAKVMGKGVHFEETTPDTISHWDAPPLLWKGDSSLPFFVDLTGTRQGELVVVGLLKGKNKSWVVRCKCGDYEIRSAKAIRNPKNSEDRCIECRRTFYFRESNTPNGKYGTPRRTGYVKTPPPPEVA